MSDMVKMKKAESLSTLNEKERRGREEATLHEKTEPEISTAREPNKPRIDPRIAKELPHQFAIWSFFLKAKDPTAPIASENSTAKKIVCEK
jgi:hypothetical protein